MADKKEREPTYRATPEESSSSGSPEVGGRWSGQSTLEHAMRESQRPGHFYENAQRRASILRKRHEGSSPRGGYGEEFYPPAPERHAGPPAHRESPEWSRSWERPGWSPEEWWEDDWRGDYWRTQGDPHYRSAQSYGRRPHFAVGPYSHSGRGDWMHGRGDWLHGRHAGEPSSHWLPPEYAPPYRSWSEFDRPEDRFDPRWSQPSWSPGYRPRPPEHRPPPYAGSGYGRSFWTREDDYYGELGRERERRYEREGRGRRWAREPMIASDIMTRNVKTVPREASLRNVARIMNEENCGIVPVVDENHRLVGVVTDRDIVIRALADEEPWSDIKVEDVMTKDVEPAVPDEELADVIELMGEKQIRRVPVVDRDDRLVGIISMADVATRAHQDDSLNEALKKICSQRSFWSRLWG